MEDDETIYFKTRIFTLHVGYAGWNIVLLKVDCSSIDSHEDHFSLYLMNSTPSTLFLINEMLFGHFYTHQTFIHNCIKSYKNV